MECIETESNLELGIRTQQVFEAHIHNSKIINSLNMDCWHMILDQLTVKEIMDTEWTCKDWQHLMLEHLAHRPLAIYKVYIEELVENTLILKTSSEASLSFKRWLRKCGRSIYDFEVDCRHFKDVEILRYYCPNLIGLTLSTLKKKLPPTDKLHFQKLVWLDLEYCDELTDDCISQFLTNNLEKLSITNNKRVTGRFLNNLKPDNNVRCLTLKHCRAFKLPFLLSATDRLTNLENLELSKNNRSKIEIRDQLHLLLDRLPELRVICFEVYDLLSDNVDRLAESDRFFESVRRLENLERVKANFHAWDHHLEAIAISCKEISDVELICTGMTQVGLDTLCRHAGPQLRQLGLSESLITADDVIACVYACPNLLYLELRECRMLDYASVMRRIADARRDLRKRLPASERCHSLRVRLQLVMCYDDDEGDEGWDFYAAIGEIEDVIHVRFPTSAYIHRLY